MLFRFHLVLLFVACCVGNADARVRFSECRGAHGERVFSDSIECAEKSVREWSLSVPAIAPPADSEKSDQKSTRRQGRSGKRSNADDPRDSYLCIAGNRTWYQHSPCRASAGQKGESVRQTRVSRQQACREIARPAAVLRKGNHQDERAGPYARATGRDPCS